MMVRIAVSACVAPLLILYPVSALAQLTPVWGLGAASCNTFSSVDYSDGAPLRSWIVGALSGMGRAAQSAEMSHGLNTDLPAKMNHWGEDDLVDSVRASCANMGNDPVYKAVNMAFSMVVSTDPN